MAQNTRPNQQGQPPAEMRDYLTWWSAGLGFLILILPVAIARHGHNHQGVASAAFVVGILLASPVVDRLEERKREIAGTLGVVTLLYGLFVIWPWHAASWLIPPCLIVYATAAINGGKGTKKRAARKARAGLSAIATMHLPPEAKIGKEVAAGNGTTRMKFETPSGTGKWNPEATRRNIATDLGIPLAHVELADLHEQRTGLHELAIRTGRPFSNPIPKRPANKPDGTFALGVDGDGNIIWVPTDLHGIIAGETGSGKSNTLNVITAAAHEAHRGLFLIDPKQTELYPWRHLAAGYGDDAKSIMDVLHEIEAIGNRRRIQLREAGRKNWTAKDGPFLTVVLDEMSELARICPAAMGYAESFARLFRSAGFQIWFADQYPTTDVFPKVIKQNTPIVVGHRVKNGVAERVILGEDATKEGFGISGPLPPGRAVVELPGIGRRWVQVFPDPGVPGNPVQPVQPPPPSTPTTLAEHGVAGVAPQVAPSPWLHVVQDDDGDDLYPHDGSALSARDMLLIRLSAVPQSAAQLAKVCGCSRQNLADPLLKLEAEGLVLKTSRGWVRA